MDTTMADVLDDDESPSGLARRYVSEIVAYEKAAAMWWKQCERILKRYKEERPSDSSKRRFAMLWSNMETMKPAVYARPPQPVVTRRFRDDDDVGRYSSEVLQRALSYAIDAYNFDQVIRNCRDDFLLSGRGQAWVRYRPTFEPIANDNDGDNHDEDPGTEEGQVSSNQESAERLVYEEALTDYVALRDFGHNVARNWHEVWFVYRRVYLTRDELTDRFGEDIGKRVPLDWGPDDGEDDTDERRRERTRKAMVYECWDKTRRQVFWISKGMMDTPLDVRDDPLGLREFFPCPMPVYGTLGSDSLFPVPDYEYYRDQAEEIDILTQRIGTLSDALKLVGFYAGENQQVLQQAFSQENANRLVPVETWNAFRDGGGAKGIIEWVPIDMVAQALQACVQLRKQLIDDVYQVTGISDIMRGETDPNETKGAQELKSTWGSSRVRTKQVAMANFARDLMRLMSEVIANKFQVRTLQLMTDVDLFTKAEAAQAQFALQQMQQQAQMLQQQTGQAPPQPPQLPPDIMDKLGRPTWDDVEQLLRDRAMRCFRIDVETDSTVEPDMARVRADSVQFVQVIGDVIAKSLPVVQAAPPMAKLLGETVKFLTRKFDAGRELEDIIDKTMDQLAGQPAAPPTGTEQKAGPDPQIEAAKVQVAKEKNQIDVMKVQTQHQENMASLAAEDRRTQADREHDAMQSHMDRQHDAALTQQADIADTLRQARDLTLKREIMQNRPKVAQ